MPPARILTVSLHFCCLVSLGIILVDSKCRDKGVFGSRELPATPRLAGPSLPRSDLLSHSATLGEPRAHTVTAALPASVAICKSSAAFPMDLEQLQLLGEGKEHLFSLRVIFSLQASVLVFLGKTEKIQGALCIRLQGDRG